ncbi:Probable RNA-directed DNA polymerase from transposon BS [Eumeta japonica]|uniref:Probable RNA-directed DNA polymerase from transposon BS n=1 Tax=Eumeta variegata TaxID=151549 RepID=A0A4C1SV29_EUMVA|nr:Probable RNA-directed DNA polymerase from transposon BS [Eumeta japonica]
MSVRNKRSIYTMCIRPVTTYACPAYATPTALNDLQIIQNNFSGRATDAQWYFKNSVLHRDLELLPHTSTVRTREGCHPEVPTRVETSRDSLCRGDPSGPPVGESLADGISMSIGGVR